MVSSAKLVYYTGLLITLVLSQSGWAQTGSATSWLAHTELRRYPTHFEKITYNGKHQEYFTVRTYLPDSTLYRIDNFKRIYEINRYNYPRDTGRVAVRHGSAKVMYPTGQLYLTCDYNLDVLNGPFMVYFSDGAIKRRELYKNGHLKESHCYTEDGQETACEAFYQLPRFTGDRNQLKSFLEKKFQAIVDGQTVDNVQIQLTINEIGQISRTTVVSTQSSPRLVYAVEQVIRSMPRWNETASDWKPASVDSIPISEVWTIYIYRFNNYLRVVFS